MRTSDDRPGARDDDFDEEFDEDYDEDYEDDLEDLDAGDDAPETADDYLPYEAAAEPGVGEIAPSAAAREPSFAAKGAASAKMLLREAANYKELRKTPYGLKPVIFFMLAGTVQALDGQIFGIAGPEIIRDLKLDIVALNNVLSVIAFMLIAAGLGMAYLADRWRRIPFFAIGTAITGVASLLTGAFARSLVSFGVLRGADSVATRILATPIGSLQADYYPPDSRGKVFALSGVLGRAAGLAAPSIVAILVTATSLQWRFPFLITGPLLIVIGLAAFSVLREPVRGYMERRALGVPEDVALQAEEVPSFGEAWRTIWAIRTLRRLFLAQIWGSAGDATFGFLFGLFVVERYGLNIGQRAALATGLGLASLPSGFLAGGLVDTLLRRRPSQVLLLTGGLSLTASFVLFFLVLGPPLWVLVVLALLFGSASTLLGPATGVLFANIVPAHVRSLGGSVFSLAAIPGIFARLLFVSFALDNWGIQGGLFVAVPFMILDAAISLSAAPFYERDVRAAMASQLASSEWRRAKDTGRGKMLVCRNVDVEYDGVQVLFGVDFDVEEGEVIALLGTNGAGKSTLLRAISGSQEASGGAVVFDGRDITHMPPHEIARRGVIHMPGGRGVFPGLTVRENLMLGTWTLEGDAEARERLDEVFAMFPILRDRASERAGTLSGGEQQMLSLAQAFLNRPRLLMIDELSLGLSPAVVGQLLDAVRAINRAGTTVIVVEQSVNVALNIAGRAIFMEKGEVKFVGRTEDLLNRPDILRAVYVKGTGSMGAVTRSRRREAELEAAVPVLEVEGLTKSYGGVVAVDGVGFELREGEVLGLIGPNGAGKTTVFDLVSGYQIADAGTVRYRGEDVTNLDPEARARKGLVRRFQDARLFPPLTVYENLLVALELKLEVRSTLLNAAQLPQARRAERRIRVRAERLIELFDLGSYRDKFVKELSTGLRRITDIACVLAADPKVLLLDEPSSGIAQAEAESLAPLLRRVRYDTGCSILIIEHDMPLISSVSDELLALDLGRVVTRGSPDEVLNDERVVASYLGGDESVIRRSGRQ